LNIVGGKGGSGYGDRNLNFESTVTLPRDAKATPAD